MSSTFPFSFRGGFHHETLKCQVSQIITFITGCPSKHDYTPSSISIIWHTWVLLFKGGGTFCTHVFLNHFFSCKNDLSPGTTPSPEGMGRRETFRGGRRGLEFSRMPRVIIIIPRERQRGVEFCRSTLNNFLWMPA